MEQNNDLKLKFQTSSPAKVITEDFPQILKKVALVLFAMPPTQASVERIFSVLKLLKTDLRSRLKADILDAAIFLRCNKCIKPDKKLF